MSFNFRATSWAVLKPFCLMIVSRSTAVRLTVILESDSAPESAAKPPPPPGDEAAGCLTVLIYCIKAPPVGSVAYAFEYPAPPLPDDGTALPLPADAFCC
jgi:hypothetical protein